MATESVVATRVSDRSVLCEWAPAAVRDRLFLRQAVATGCRSAELSWAS